MSKHWVAIVLAVMAGLLALKNAAGWGWCLVVLVLLYA